MRQSCHFKVQTGVPEQWNLRFDTTGSKFFKEPVQSDEEEPSNSHIEWSNLIFLPFHPVFQKIVLISVIVKTFIGPILSIDHHVRCWNSTDENDYLLNLLVFFYSYIADAIYGIDTLLHIIHRQVVDKAMRREYMPKSAFLLILDILSLIPFYRLVVQDPTCSREPRLYPNFLTYNEFLIIYRIWEFYRLSSTHFYPQLIGGFIIIMTITLNSVTVFWILLTLEGLCNNCSSSLPDNDWRTHVIDKMNGSEDGYQMYKHAISFICTHAFRRVVDNILPSTILEFLMTCLFMIAGYIILYVFVLPKAFSEYTLRLKNVCTKYPLIKKIIEETKRRNASHKAYKHVETYYTTMWKRRSGIVHMPDIMTDIPRHLKLSIKEDLFWPLIHHSPTLRRRSYAFKRFLFENVHISYKLPGEKFYAGSQSLSNIYYIKSGVVQLISVDDGTTPILSVTSGTVFGDINFLIPHSERKVAVRCLTYCEVLFLTQRDLLKALYKFPEDRKAILLAYKDKINHAKQLLACKEQTKGLDRSEAEGIGWIKSRWWQIFDAIGSWRKNSIRLEREVPNANFELPPETCNFHCAKYIGQLVLCSEGQLDTKSMFVNYSFPWILSPYSSFDTIWKKIVMWTVFIAILIYPHYIISRSCSRTIYFILLWIDIVYVADLCVSLSTAVKIRENERQSFGTIMLERCKRYNFIMDIISTVWIANIFRFINVPLMHYAAQFNRLIKMYVLFSSHYIKWDLNKSPMGSITLRIILLNICFITVSSYFVYEFHYYHPELTFVYFYGEKIENNENLQPLIGVIVPWTFEFIFPSHVPITSVDIYFAIAVSVVAYIVNAFCKAKLLAYLYLRYRDATDYQYLVLNLKEYYLNNGISKDLLKRLEKYLVCHFKYYKGLKVMDRDSFKQEPFEIYWKVQGEVALKIIGESKAFTSADPLLVRELACASKYVILPKNAVIILFGYECENATWLVQGCVKSESYGPNGEMVIKYHGPGSMLSVTAVLFDKLARKTYTCYTDCEIIYVNTQEFLQIYKRFPLEWYFLRKSVKQFRLKIQEAFEKQVNYYKECQVKRNIRQSEEASSSKLITEIDSPPDPYTLLRDYRIWKDSEHKVMQTWLLVRAITVCVSIANASLKGGIGAPTMGPFHIIGLLCDFIAFVDILLKLFLSYYNSEGLLVTDTGMCLLNYLTKGFLLDIIGTLPWFEIFRALMSKNIDWTNAMLMNTCCKFAHIYILFAYFDYICDLPTVNNLYRVIKWQVLNILIVLGASQYLMSHCVDYNFDSDKNLVDMNLRNTCWMPQIFSLPQKLNGESLHLIFAQSIYLTQCGMMSMNVGGFMLQNSCYGMMYVLIFLGVISWTVTCYVLSILILACRENTHFQYGVDSLDTFLRNERVENNMIEKAIQHFRYCWRRTKGINIEQMLNKRIGMVFGQDLTYACYKTTYIVLDTLLMGGEHMQKQLASVSSIRYFLAGHEIMREMDLVADLYVVHRGTVILKKDGKKIITLTKGDIFGQLEGTRLRPVKISAKADTHADVLQLSVKNFQKIITDEVRKIIKDNRQSRNDFLATRTWFVENPYNSIEYILRAKKVIQLPWMPKPVKADIQSWYAWWLYMMWFGGPCITAFIVVILPWTALPPGYVLMLYVILILLDILHIGNIVCEFYSANLVVENNKCVRRIIGFGILKKCKFYLDALTLIIPLLNIITNDRRYQLVKLLRLKWLIDFNYHFCRGFKTKWAPRALKAVVILLLIHIFTCGWLYVACSGSETAGPIYEYMTLGLYVKKIRIDIDWESILHDKFPFRIPDFNKLNISVNYEEWTHPDLRKGGCPRPTKKVVQQGDKVLPAFVVPVHWRNDYIIAMTFILLIHTHTSLDAVMAITINQLYYKIFITFALYLIDMWLLALIVSAVYNKFRNFYRFDYNVINFTTFLKDCGLCPFLMEAVRKYTEQMWTKYRGSWLPKLIYQGPICLREDLFVALYIHHLNRPSTFRELPYYFKRQLAARLQRIVIFPNKSLVQQGDVFNVTYFIHEGEVEKWCTDSEGEEKFVSLIYPNGYFGCIPGLLTNAVFQYSYYTRTVVDLVYLRLENWEDLLEGYPEIKRSFTDATRALKPEGVKVAEDKARYEVRA